MLQVSKESPVCEPRARLGRNVLATFHMATCSVIDLLSARVRPRLNLLRVNANRYSGCRSPLRRTDQLDRPACQNKQGVLTAASRNPSSWNLLENPPKIPIKPDGRR
jgi:hypothetical protein